jgi:hypothetical protein
MASQGSYVSSFELDAHGILRTHQFMSMLRDCTALHRGGNHLGNHSFACLSPVADWLWDQGVLYYTTHTANYDPTDAGEGFLTKTASAQKMLVKKQQKKVGNTPAPRCLGTNTLLTCTAPSSGPLSAPFGELLLSTT